MACTPIKIGDMNAIICHRGRRTPRCKVCENAASFQCDHPRPKRPDKTCDKHLCKTHAHEIGPDQHYCPDHLKAHNATPLQRGILDGLL